MFVLLLYRRRYQIQNIIRPSLTKTENAQKNTIIYDDIFHFGNFFHCTKHELMHFFFRRLLYRVQHFFANHKIITAFNHWRGYDGGTLIMLLYLYFNHNGDIVCPNRFMNTLMH